MSVRTRESVNQPGDNPGDARKDGLRWLKSRVAPRVLRVLGAIGATVSRDDVVWCYRNLLRREPESERAIAAHSRFVSFRSLVKTMVGSPEYAGQRPAQGARSTILDLADPISSEDFAQSIARHVQGASLRAEQLDYIEMHTARLRDTLTIVRHLMPNGGHILDYCATGFFRQAVDDWLTGVTQTSVAGVNFELDEYVARYGEARYDLCLNTEVLEHLLYDPSHMLFSINRMLKPDGHLLLTTPNALSTANALQLMNGHAPTVWNQLTTASKKYYERHNRDWTPFEVERILSEHGFEVRQTFTRDYYAATHSILSRHRNLREMLEKHSTHGHFGDTMFVLARKARTIDAPVRNPWLYMLPSAP
jgi:SAM-dependent methyltransferase